VIEVNASIDALSDLLRRTLGSRIHLELELDPMAGRVEVDPAQLDNAILNAAVNARDAMPSGGSLRIVTAVEASTDGYRVRISVADTGLGMPQRVLERAFDPFFTTKPIGEGTGLGLSQIHGFAAQAGGHAEISSTEGSGTTVSIILPQTGKELTVSDPASPAPELPAGTKILLVEDNAQVQAFGAELLQDLGCDVRCAASGEEALEVLAEYRPDAVLTDIVMPGMSGIDLAEEISAAHPSLPVILATGYSEQAAKGFQRLPMVLKPYSGLDLASAITGTMRRFKTASQT
jgi:CheY-like chemotaxis protein